MRGLAETGWPVVVGHDGSPTSEAALGFAFTAAALRGAGLTVVLCRRAGTAAWARDDALDEWQSRHPDVRVRRVQPRDHPVRALLRHGTEAQLLVVGSHGRGGFDGMLLGSTSQALVSHAPCPLVVVTSAGRRGSVQVR